MSTCSSEHWLRPALEPAQHTCRLFVSCSNTIGGYSLAAAINLLFYSMRTVDSLRALELTLALEARSSAVKSRRLEQRLAAALLWTRWRCESVRSCIHVDPYVNYVNFFPVPHSPFIRTPVFIRIPSVLCCVVLNTTAD
jgi:hypothetical protein